MAYFDNLTVFLSASFVSAISSSYALASTSASYLSDISGDFVLLNPKLKAILIQDGLGDIITLTSGSGVSIQDNRGDSIAISNGAIIVDASNIVIASSNGTNVLGRMTSSGSLYGTASWAVNVVNGNISGSSGTSLSSSWASSSLSASYSATSSVLTGISSSNIYFDNTGSTIIQDGHGDAIYLNNGIVLATKAGNTFPVNVLGPLYTTTVNASIINGPSTSSGIQLYDAGLGRYVTVTCFNGFLSVN